MVLQMYHICICFIFPVGIQLSKLYNLLVLVECLNEYGKRIIPIS